MKQWMLGGLAVVVPFAVVVVVAMGADLQNVQACTSSPVVAASGGRVVTASFYGGPTDPTSGATGYKGDNLYQHPDSFAELNMGTALGNLPYMTPIDVTYGGRTIRVYKRDIGAGGPGLDGHVRAVDLWFEAAQKLHMPGLANVRVTIGKKADPPVAGPCAVGAGPATIAQLVVMARGAIGAPYCQCNHASAFLDTEPEMRTLGTDCSGFVSWLMGPKGLGIWTVPLTTPYIPTAPHLLPGPGKFVTLLDNPGVGNAGHVVIDLLGTWYQEGGAQNDINHVPAGELAFYRTTFKPFHPAGD